MYFSIHFACVDSFACFCMTVLIVTHNVNEKSVSNKRSPKCMNTICILDDIVIKALLLLF